MTDLRKAAQMALDWADNNGEAVFAVGGWEGVSALNKWSLPLRAALAQPEQEPTRSQKLRDAGYTRRPKGWSKDGEEPEPVAWMHTTATGDVYFRKKPHDKVFNPQPVYTAPLHREWVGLTDEEYETMAEQHVTNCYFDTLTYAKAIEAKLKEKNSA